MKDKIIGYLISLVIGIATFMLLNIVLNKIMDKICCMNCQLYDNNCSILYIVLGIIGIIGMVWVINYVREDW